MAVNSKDGGIGIIADGINDGQPFAVSRYRYVRRCARQGHRFVEHPTLAVAEEDGDCVTRGVARKPDVPRSFRHPGSGARERVNLD